MGPHDLFQAVLFGSVPGFPEWVNFPDYLGLWRT
jgi:hypothetical protein